MEKTITFLLFIGSTPKYLFLGNKMHEPMYRVEVFAVSFLALAISAVLSMVSLLFFETKNSFCIFFYTSFSLLSLIFLWKVFSVKEDTIKNYFRQFSQMSKWKAFFLWVLSLVMMLSFILIPVFLADIFLDS